MSKRKFSHGIAVFILLISAPRNPFAQDYNEALSHFYFGRQTSARAEALGTGLVETIELDTNQKLSFGASLFNLTHSKISYLVRPFESSIISNYCGRSR
jgi:hypothetical protein